MNKILLVTTTSARYQMNTQMEKVIGYLRSKSEVSHLDLASHNFEHSVCKKIEKCGSVSEADCVFFVDGPPTLFLSLEELNKLRETFVTAMFFGDIFAHFHSSYKYFAQCVDIALVDEVVELGAFQKLCPEVHFVPYAYEVDDKWAFDPKKKNTVSFVGRSDRRNRKEYLSALERQCPVDIYGLGSHLGPVSDERIKHIFNESLVNLNFSGVQDDQPYIHARPIDLTNRSPKGRCQEIGISGGFVLSEYAPGLDEMFDIGSTIDIFYDAEELSDKVAYYLGNPELTLEMAKRHHDASRIRYEISAVWDPIIKKLTSRPRRRFENEIFTDDIFELAESRALATLVKSSKEAHGYRPLITLIKNLGIHKFFRLVFTYLSHRLR